VVFIPKGGRNDYTAAKSYRPISLASFILKTLERYIRQRVLRDTSLHRNQHAYLPTRSCITALHNLVMAIKEIALAAFMDIEGAFANKHGVDVSITKWINSMLQSRIIRANLLSEVREITATRGCPQGGVLSPLLWSLVVDELLTKLTQEGYYIQSYADDIAIVVFGKFPNTVTDLMNRGLREINNWCKKEGLGVNPQKTIIVPFTRKNLRCIGPVRYQNINLKLSESAKYLGLTLDRKLTWN